MTAPATVLVADDHASVRDGVARLLRSAGYRVLTAADGERALEICRSEHPAVAILDLTLPNIDGRAVCRALRADPAAPYVPVLAMAVGADSVLRAATLRDGADGVIEKDYDKDELLARVEALLRVRRLLDAPRRPSDGASGPQVGRDSLTGAWSAAYLQERLDSELQRASRRNEPLSLMAVLIDERARLAGEHGAATGDLALIAAAEAIGRCSRGMDVVARCDAPDFAVILPATHFAGAMATADRMWRELARTRIPLAKTGTEAPLRASIGIACFPNRQVKTGRELLEFARTALERARTEGPAHICLVQHQAYIFQPE